MAQAFAILTTIWAYTDINRDIDTTSSISLPFAYQNGVLRQAIQGMRRVQIAENQGTQPKTPFLL